MAICSAELRFSPFVASSVAAAQRPEIPQMSTFCGEQALAMATRMSAIGNAFKAGYANHGRLVDGWGMHPLSVKKEHILAGFAGQLLRKTS